MQQSTAKLRARERIFRYIAPARTRKDISAPCEVPCGTRMPQRTLGMHINLSFVYSRIYGRSLADAFALAHISNKDIFVVLGHVLVLALPTFANRFRRSGASPSSGGDRGWMEGVNHALAPKWPQMEVADDGAIDGDRSTLTQPPPSRERRVTIPRYANPPQSFRSHNTYPALPP